METSSIYAVIITLITVLGSASAWRFYEKRSTRRKSVYDRLRDECNERVRKVEELLRKSSEDKNDMRSEILNLTSENSELRTTVSFLKKENDKLLGKTSRRTTIKRKTR